MNLKRNLYSILFLAIFLFPYVETGVHDFSHRNDEVCFVHGAKHIHSLEHSCAICDLVLPVSGTLPETTVVPQSDFITTDYCSFVSSFFSSSVDPGYSPRGPPVV